MCPSSVLGNKVPSTKNAEPIPVPNVRKMTAPLRAASSPKATSAMPAASASLSTEILSRPNARVNRSCTLVPTHESSMLAAVRATCWVTTDGRVMPTGPSHSHSRTICATTSATASGVAGFGVAIFTRLPTKSPVCRSTTAPFTPEPPISTPKPRAFCVMQWKCTNATRHRPCERSFW